MSSRTTPHRRLRRIGSARSSDSRGQALVEFGLIAPFMFLIVIAIADLGRMYTSAVGAESAAREAADYGAFIGTAAWDESNAVQMAANDAEMRRRACTAASRLPDYREPAGTVNHATCTNPTVTWALVRPAGMDPTKSCSAVTPSETPCRVHVTVNYTFHTIVSFPPMPASIALVRDSWFTISDLPNS